MSTPLHVLFVCGYGVGTSAMAAINVQKALKAERISAEVQHTSLGNMGSLKDWADVICIAVNLQQGVRFEPGKHIVTMINILDGPGIAGQIGKIVDEYYPGIRE